MKKFILSIIVLSILFFKKWEEYAIKISNWFMVGEIEYFENTADAIAWINSGEYND
jgi:hypothetical protein